MSNTMVMMAAALGAELVLLLVVLLVVSYVRTRAQKRRDIKAIKALVMRIRNGKPEREKALVRFLTENMGLSGAPLEKAKVAMLRAEIGLLQRFAGVYRLRDAAAVARFDDDLFSALDPYHALNGGAGSQAAGEAAEVDNGELEALRQENGRLTEELRITMETMSRMLNEYSNMFAGGTPDDAAPIAPGAAVAAAAAAPGSEAQEAAGVELDEDALSDEPEAVAEAVSEEDAVPAQAASDASQEESDADGVTETPEVTDAVDDIDALLEQAGGGNADVEADMTDADSDAAGESVGVTEVEEAAQPAEDITADSAPPSADDEAADPDGPGTGDTSALEADASDDDLVAEVLREAASREQSARGEQSNAMEDDLPGSDEDDVDGMIGATLEEGDSEVLEFDEAEVEDIDDLFDDAPDVESASDLAQRKSQSGS